MDGGILWRKTEEVKSEKANWIGRSSAACGGGRPGEIGAKNFLIFGEPFFCFAVKGTVSHLKRSFAL